MSINFEQMNPLDIPLKLHEAIRFAELKHRGQVRKGSEIAYIVHPLEVLQILMAENCSIELAIAGILHDTLEDTDTTEDEIRERFGDKVLAIVSAHSEKKADDDGERRPWRVRKEEDLAMLRQSDREVKQLVLADSIANLRSMVYDYKIVGDELWERFNAGKDEISWYYSEKIDIFYEFIFDEMIKPDYWELNSLFKHLFVDFYLNNENELYQVTANDIFVLTHGGMIEWEMADEVPAGAKPISKDEAEELEETWRAEI